MCNLDEKISYIFGNLKKSRDVLRGFNMFRESGYNVEELLSTAVRAALEAGAAIMEVYLYDDFGVREKADNSPVTLADLRADDIIARLLGETGLPLLSEEGRVIPFGERKAWRLSWLVDPLDGTREFISRNGEFTVNIALVEDGNPVAGVVYAPVIDVLYAGLSGAGAWRVDGASKALRPDAGKGPSRSNQHSADSGFSLNLPGSPDREGQDSGHGNGGLSLLKSAVALPCAGKDGYGIAASRSHPDDRTGAFIEEFCEMYSGTRIITRGSSLKLCMLAEGEADIYPRFRSISEWDTAAGHAIVLASGGHIVEALRIGRELVYNKEVNRNPWFIGFRDHKLLESVKGLIPKGDFPDDMIRQVTV